MTVTLEHSVEEFIGAPRQLFINGQWAEAASGKTFETPNPATGETPRTSTGRSAPPAPRSRTGPGAG